MKRIDNMARRYMVKIFLNHLYKTWREMEGLTVREPYPIEYLGHSTVIEASDYVTVPA